MVNLAASGTCLPITLEGKNWIKGLWTADDELNAIDDDIENDEAMDDDIGNVDAIGNNDGIGKDWAIDDDGIANIDDIGNNDGIWNDDDIVNVDAMDDDGIGNDDIWSDWTWKNWTGPSSKPELLLQLAFGNWFSGPGISPSCTSRKSSAPARLKLKCWQGFKVMM